MLSRHAMHSTLQHPIDSSIHYRFTQGCCRVKLRRNNLIQLTPRTPEKHDNHFILEQSDTRDSTKTHMSYNIWISCA